ncbi:hypothetical protein XELAEV_18042018mg [Xenopus laevis]|uniref:DNA helicase n=1 Tax=Xenopus laevis TaxID=8355 RepID=A0A974C380_XENLA|nr:hypothetical protein XELAEV_18042018mg [Xenopus laevis]
MIDVKKGLLFGVSISLTYISRGCPEKFEKVWGAWVDVTDTITPQEFGECSYRQKTALARGSSNKHHGVILFSLKSQKISEIEASHSSSESKLNTLVQKLHEFLAHSSEESEDTPRQSISRRAAKVKSVNRLHPMENNMDEGSTSEKFNSLGSSRSKRKPSFVQKYVGSDEEMVPDKAVNIDGSNENSENEVNMESLPIGTVVVQPEPVLNEDKDDFKGPEFRIRNKPKPGTPLPKKRTEDGLHGIVNCTACGQQVNHFQKDSIYRHPALKVLICKTCYKYYMSDEINRDADGMDEQCRWCAEGGNLICCDYCHNAFCKKCIQRNLGRKELSAIMDEDSKWECYVCRPEPLLDSVAACDSVFENLEQLLQQNKKKMKVDNEKNKSNEHSQNHSDKNNSSCNGQVKNIGDAHAGTLTYSYRALMVPKEMLKKAKRLIETTTSLNASFVKFMKQGTENNEMNPDEKLRQLKAFKSVLSDLKKAHQALEETLMEEVSSVEEQKKSKKSRETPDETTHAKEKKLSEEKHKAQKKIAAHEKRKPSDSDNKHRDPDMNAFYDTEQAEEVRNKNGKSSDLTEEHIKKSEPLSPADITQVLTINTQDTDNNVNMEDTDENIEGESEKEAAESDKGKQKSQKKKHKSMLDKPREDSPGSSKKSIRLPMKECDSPLPEKTKEKIMGNRCTEALKSGKSCTPQKKNKNAEATFEPNSTEALDMDIVSVPSSVPEDIFDSLDLSIEQQNSLQDSVTGTTVSTSVKFKEVRKELKPLVKKQLVVQLTPVSLSSSPLKADNSNSCKSPKNGNGSDAEMEAPNQNNTSCDEVLENTSENDLEECALRRSPRVKTTPRRRQTAANSATSNTEEESNDTDKEKNGKMAACSKEKQISKAKHSPADSGESPKAKWSLAKKMKTQKNKSTSDSDDVPGVLKNAALMSKSSSEFDSSNEANNGKKSSNHVEKATKGDGKRKRSTSSSGSELTKRTTRNSTATKKQRWDHSDTSNSELERELKKLCKKDAINKGSKQKFKKKEESIESSDEKHQSRSQKAKISKRERTPASNKKESSSDLSEEEQENSHNSDEDSDEQKIKPLVENEVVSATGFVQSSGDEARTICGAASAENDDDDDDDPENRYDSIHMDIKKIITHPKRGPKAEHRKSKQVVQTRTSCLVKTRSQAARKFERVAIKTRPKNRKSMRK